MGVNMESVNEIINGVAFAISEVFGEGCNIYTDEKEQGFSEPCFFIFCKNPTKERFFGKRFIRKNQVKVKYFASKEEKNADLNVVREKLYGCLEVIEVDGDRIMGTKMEGVAESGVIDFVVNYDFFVYEESDVELMNSYDFKQNGKV